MKKKLRKTCVECGSSNIVYNREDDQTICQDCGAIFEELTPEEEEELEAVAEEDVPEKE